MLECQHGTEKIQAVDIMILDAFGDMTDDDFRDFEIEYENKLKKHLQLLVDEGIMINHE